MDRCRRKTKKACMDLKEAISSVNLQKDPDGLVEKMTSSKGRGVFARQTFEKDDFLLIYHGERVTGKEGLLREEKTPSVFRFFFTHNFKGKELRLCIDATEEPQEGLRLGRLVNHGDRYLRNAKIKVIEVDGSPYLALFATKTIRRGEEILYDYGVPEKDLPWNKKLPVPAQTHSTDATTEDCCGDTRTAPEGQSGYAAIEDHSGDFPAIAHSGNALTEAYSGGVTIAVNCGGAPAEAHSRNTAAKAQSEDTPIKACSRNPADDGQSGDAGAKAYCHDYPNETHSGDAAAESHLGDAPIEACSRNVAVDGQSGDASAKAYCQDAPNEARPRNGAAAEPYHAYCRNTSIVTSSRNVSDSHSITAAAKDHSGDDPSEDCKKSYRDVVLRDDDTRDVKMLSGDSKDVPSDSESGSLSCESSSREELSNGNSEEISEEMLSDSDSRGVLSDVDSENSASVDPVEGFLTQKGVHQGCHDPPKASTRPVESYFADAVNEAITSATKTRCQGAPVEAFSRNPAAALTHAEICSRDVATETCSGSVDSVVG
ncbi:uncharacterized protein LOC110983334 isoform X2 [Acanthaster planci]|nr:uncharacterized protein LOC110983334 isoform X2 [Acanthaster planci]